MAGKWLPVTRQEVCAVCHKADWCQRSADGEMAHCMRVESKSPVASGGWSHRLTDPLPKVELTGKKQPTRLSPKEVSEQANRMYEHNLAAETRERVAETLGVAVSALEKLTVGFGCDWNGKTFSSWPCRNARGEFVGITRRYDDGEKRTYPGTSNAGVFACDAWYEFGGEVWIVEGGSDTAACIGKGIAAIGRPSNIGGANVIAPMLRRRAKDRKVVVWVEMDRKEKCTKPVNPCKGNAHCLQCWPGFHGAQKVAAELADKIGRSVSIAWPRGKDIREDLAC